MREFLQGRRQSFYLLFAEDTFSEWSGLTCGCPGYEGTKLATLLFLAVINPILAEFEGRFKFVNDLSALLKYIIENAVTKQHRLSWQTSSTSVSRIVYKWMNRNLKFYHFIHLSEISLSQMLCFQLFPLQQS